MILTLMDSNIAKILTVFSLSPGTKFRRKELKEKTKLNNINLDKSIAVLQNSKTILKENNYLKLNLDDTTKSLIELVKKEYKVFNEIPLNVFF